MRTDRYKESPVPGARVEAQALRLTALATVHTPPLGLRLSDLGAVSRAPAEVPRSVVIAERFTAGEPAALGLVYERYSSLVHGYAVRALGPGPSAEGVVERVFVTAWSQRQSFDPGHASFGSWLVGLTRRDLHATLVRTVPVTTRSASARASLASARAGARVGAPATVTVRAKGRFGRLRGAFGAPRAV